jgi:hypothetical protein
MSPGEQRLLEFIVARISSILRRPSSWGSPLSVEDQVLQLLEMRRALLGATASATDTRCFMQSYSAFIARELEGATAAPLSRQLEARGRAVDLPVLLGKFVQEDFTTLVAELGDSVVAPDDGIGGSRRTSPIDGILETLRLEIASEVGGSALQPIVPIRFPEQRKI